MSDALIALRASLAGQAATLRATTPDRLPRELLDIVVRRIDLPAPAAPLFLPVPADWEALRHAEGGAGRAVPYWARPWPSGLALAEALAQDPPEPRSRVIELGCGLAAPSIVAVRAGADVLATDGATDAVAFAAHAL